MIGDAAIRLFFHLFNGIKKGKGGVRFLGCRQVERRRRQMKASLRHPHLLKGLRTGCHYLDRVGVGHAHIFAGKDQHAPKDKARTFARIVHLRHPIPGGVWVAAAQALDKGADGVKVIVALFVIEDGAALD